MVWEEVEGYSRGIGIVKYLIPNQIERNKKQTRHQFQVSPPSAHLWNPDGRDEHADTLALQPDGARSYPRNAALLSRGISNRN